jgi:hypothetical protein
MTIIIGKEGQQPFNITQSGVSRQHAKITIDEHNQWFIEDMNSSNGTFVRRETDGQLVRVGKIQINPLSFICLGPDNSRGCRFFARQVLQENAGNFNEEFNYLNEKTELFEDKMNKVDRKIKMSKLILLIVNVLIIVVSFAGQYIHIGTDENGNPIPLIGNGANFMLLRIGTVASMLMATMFDPFASKKRIDNERRKFSQCPNPDCGNVLSPFDIRDYLCPRCRNKMMPRK